MIYYYQCTQTPPTPEQGVISQGFGYVDVKGREQHYPANRLLKAMEDSYGLPPSSIPPLLKEKEEIKSKLATVNAQVTQLMALVNQKNAEVRNLENANQNLQITQKGLSHELDQVKSEKNQVLQNVHQLQQTLETSQLEALADKEEKRKLNNKLQEQNDEIKVLKKTMLQLQKQNAELQDKHSLEMGTLRVDYQGKLLETYQRIDKFIERNASSHARSSVSSKTHSSVEETSEDEAS